MRLTSAGDYERVLEAVAQLGNADARASVAAVPAVAARAEAELRKASRLSVPASPHATTPAKADALQPVLRPLDTPVAPSAAQPTAAHRALNFDDAPPAGAPASAGAQRQLTPGECEAYEAHATDLERCLAELRPQDILTLTPDKLIAREREDPSPNTDPRLAALVTENSKLRYQLAHLQRALHALQAA